MRGSSKHIRDLTLGPVCIGVAGIPVWAFPVYDSSSESFGNTFFSFHHTIDRNAWFPESDGSIDIATICSDMDIYMRREGIKLRKIRCFTNKRDYLWKILEMLFYTISISVSVQNKKVIRRKKFRCTHDDRHPILKVSQSRGCTYIDTNS